MTKKRSRRLISSSTAFIELLGFIEFIGFVGLTQLPHSTCGFGEKMLMIAIEADDPGMIPSVNEEIEKGRTENERWRRELIALSQKYNIKVE
jgi:hypothetical protein